MNARLTVQLALAAIIVLTSGAWAGSPTAPGTENISGEQGILPVDPVDLEGALLGGADYVKAMQADVTDDNAGNGTDGVDESPDDPDDGGWDWRVTTPPDPVSHTTSASPKNLYGATAIGLYYAYLVEGDATYLTAMTDAADVMIGDADIRSAADLVFLMLFNDLPDVSGTTYQDAAKTKYDGRITTYGSATALAEYIRDARAGQGYENGIIAWDIGPWARAAAMLDDRYGGYASDADDIAEVIYQDSFNDTPGYFDIIDDAGWDPTYGDTNFWWYTLGISGLITGFVASDTHMAEVPGLVTRLLDSQYTSGAISGSYGANTDDEDWQSTAYAVLAIILYDADTYAAEIDDMCAWLANTRDVLTGGWRYSSGNHYPEVCGENTAAIGAYFGLNTVTPDPSGDCLSVTNLCETVPVNFNRVDVTEARGISVTFELSAELELCVDVANSINQGTWLDGYSETFQVVDNLDGTYTVDQAILGTPCGTATGGELFTVDVKAAGGDGTGTIMITEVIARDCSNRPLPATGGAASTITIDTAPPDFVADLLATQIKSGNGTDGTTMITISFTAPVSADDVFVYRKGFGDYPEYDDGTGVTPTAPTDPSDAVANGWTLTGVTANGETDEPATRDFWYYVVFTEDACDNVSAVSNITEGTLNYHLGDVTDGVINGDGDNDVGTADISLLGANYGATLIHNDPVNYLDVGPTTDYSVDARPTTDNEVEFEDLMMFAINHTEVSANHGDAPVLDAADMPELVLALSERSPRAGQTLTAWIRLENNDALVKGLHSVVSFDERHLELRDVTIGKLLENQSEQTFFKTLDAPDGVLVDAAVIGAGKAIIGTGEVAELSFRVRVDGALPKLAEIALRDCWNRNVGDAPGEWEGEESTHVVSGDIPSRLTLVGARPNPFTAGTAIAFDLPEALPVTIEVFDVNGRLVRTLTKQGYPAGHHSTNWDGSATNGARVAAGVYFYSFRAGDHREMRKLLLY